MSILKIAHRGASGYALENSFAAFDKALELNVDMIECDVRMTKDKKLILMHDKKFDRTTKGKGKISKITLSELKEKIKKYPEIEIISIKTNKDIDNLKI